MTENNPDHKDQIFFKQFDLPFKRFNYTIEENGLRIQRIVFITSAESFVPFENVGSEMIVEKSRKLGWLILSLFFLLLAAIVFYNRMTGGKVGEAAELFYLTLSVIFFIVYIVLRRNKVFLTQANKTNSIEFIGSSRYKNRLPDFFAKLFLKRDEFLSQKYPGLDGLTTNESVLCAYAGITSEEGLFLKMATKNPVEELIFDKEFSDIKKPTAICSETTENKSREIIAKNQQRFINEGKYIFISSFSGNAYKVGLVGTTSDPYEVMKYAETNGINYDIETGDIIEKFKHWNEAFGIKVIGIGFDFCECEIINKEIDYKKLADEVFEFCPDTVDQGVETIENLEKEIKRTGRIFLWWD